MLKIESINFSEWNSVRFEDGHLLPQINGLYAVLASNGTPLYIGRTTNLWKRWRMHKKKSVLRAAKAQKIAYLELGFQGLQDLESSLLRKYAPRFNDRQVLRNGLTCPYCGSGAWKTRTTHDGRSGGRCRSCKRTFTKDPKKVIITRRRLTPAESSFMDFWQDSRLDKKLGARWQGFKEECDSIDFADMRTASAILNTSRYNC